MVYGLNDLNDVYADAVNDRKGNYLFGAKASLSYLKKVPIRIGLYCLPFIVYFISVGGIEMALVLLFMVITNLVYNLKPIRLKERPPFEVFIQIGYVLVAIFSVLLNGLDMIPWQTLVYLSLFAFQAHIAGEIMDIEPDRKAGKKTTATLIGRKNTKYLMVFLLVTEVFLLSYWFQDYVLAGFLGCFIIWLLIDVFVVYKGKPYSLKEMNYFGILMNIVGLGSMLWILYAGKLLSLLS